MNKETEKTEGKNKNILSRVFSSSSYNDKSVYYFNKSLFIGSVILICFGLVLFFL